AWIDNGVYPPPGDACPPEWQWNTAYPAGSVVTYGGHKWTANQWNYNQIPGGTSGAWGDDGVCPPPPGGDTCPLEWRWNTAYPAGSVVSYKRHKWAANQWNYNQVPGGMSGAWNDNGPC
ncbi:hypothetical protein FRC11_009284, partial [Ceratobasidium sp. 423]